MHRSSFLTVVFAGLALAGCRQQPDEAAPGNVTENRIVNLPAVPTPQAPLDRAQLLSAVAEAASAAAAGTALPDDVKSLDGRQFELRIRFGCRGPAADLKSRWLGWSFDSQDRLIRVRAMPTLSKDDTLVSEVSGDQFEQVEGFWIPRPWLRQPVCPANAAVRNPAEAASNEDPNPEESAAAGASEAQPAALTPASPRIGIAQFFTDQDPRTRRRGNRPYEANRMLEEGQALSSQGFNLVLSGRLRALPGKGVIECVTRAADIPPDCVVSAEFLRVWMEQPESKEIIAEWGGG